MNATRAFSDEDRRRIRQAVAEAERQSSAEIICAAATESGRYERAESTVGLIFALLALALAHAVYSAATTVVGDWSDRSLYLGWQALAVVAGFIAGNLLAEKVQVLRRLVVSEREMERQVERAACHVFALAEIANKHARTGLLIYVSLLERRIVIRADRRAHEALGNEHLDHLRDVAVDDLRKGDFTGAFIHVIEQAAPRLAEALPADRRLDANELADHLLILHPRPSSSG